jgi:hypothetical protein
VWSNYGGNWTALFCTGSKFRIPPALAGEHIYRFNQSNGWDGQFYHYIAHDPFLTDGMWKYLDAPGMRYQRILVPALAYLLAGGDASRIDAAYRSVILLFFGLGAYWSSRLAMLYGHSRAWGLAFACVPAAIVSMDRMAVDVALAAFVMAFALYTRKGEADRRLYAVLLLSALVRETGLLLVAAYCIWLLLRKRMGRAALFGTAALPALAWYAYVAARTRPFVPVRPISLPFSGLMNRLLHPLPYTSSPLVDSVITAFDYLAVAGIVLAFVVAFPVGRKSGFNPPAWAMILFVLLGIFLQRAQWLEISDIGRILSPLLVLLALEAAGFRWLAWAPVCIVAARCALQLAPQLLGVLGLITRGHT